VLSHDAHLSAMKLREDGAPGFVVGQICGLN
jgi:hypothetical protein